MARLPVPGSDDGNWGDILNDYLRQIHTEGGLLKDSVVAETNLSVGVQNKLNALSSVTDGREIELRNNSSFIQWKYVGGSEASWTNLVSLGDLTGPTGDKGDTGTPGADGISPATPNFSASATTLAAGTSATASVSGTYPDLNIEFGIPQVDTGENPGVVKRYYRPTNWDAPGWVPLSNTRFTISTLAANRLLLVPYLLESTARLTAVQFETVTTHSTPVQVGIYRRTGYYTGDFLANLGTEDASLAGVKSITGLDVKLPPGEYFVAIGNSDMLSLSGVTAQYMGSRAPLKGINPAQNGTSMGTFYANGPSLSPTLTGVVEHEWDSQVKRAFLFALRLDNDYT